MSVKERLKCYLKYKGVSERKFAEAINVSSGYVNAISKSIQPDKLQSISMQYPDLNPVWLLTGAGEMLVAEKKEEQEEVLPMLSMVPSQILEELRENYLEKEERLVAIIESQQEVIKNQSELMKKMAVRPEENVICADVAGSEFKK